MEPTITDSEEDPAVTPEEPGKSGIDSIEVNADEEVVEHTVSIAEYRAALDSVSISISVGADDISNDGKITVEDGKNLTLTITPKTNWAIKSVTRDDVEGNVLSSGSVTLSNIKSDITLTIEAVETYDLTISKGYSLTRLTKDAEGKDVKDPLGDGEIEKDGEDLKFFVNNYDYADKNKSLTVSYILDGENVEATVLKPEEENDPLVENAKLQVYTIKDAELADSHALEIILTENSEKTVTFKVDGVANDNSKVTIQVWGEKAGENGAAVTMDWIDLTNYKVIAGANAKFKVTPVGPYKVTKIVETVGSDPDAAVSKDREATTNNEYEFKITDATEYDIVTEYDSTKSKALSFVIDGDADSATAKITKVVMNPVGDAASEEKTAAAIDALLGTKEQALVVGEEVLVPNTVKSIELEVAAATDYELTKVNTTDATDKTKEKISVNYDAIAAITAKTTAKVSAAVTYFKIAKPADGKHLTLNVGDGSGDNAVIQKVTTEGIDDTYSVKLGTPDVTITVVADEGYKLTDDFINTLKNNLGKDGTDTGAGALAGGDVSAVVGADNKTTYSIKLLATKLGNAETDPAVIPVLDSAVKTFEVTTDSESPEGFIAPKLDETTITEDENFPATGDVGAKNVPYNAKLDTTIFAKDGYRLVKVTYTMGETAGPESEILRDGEGSYFADINIAKVTGDVVIKVETAPAYSLFISEKGDDNIPVYADDEGLYSVNYNKKYVIEVSPAVGIQKLSAEIKDGETIIGRGKKIGEELQIWMNRAWAGRELTVVVNVDGEKAGELLLQVNKKRSTLSINEGADIKQTVSTTATYPIATDGDKLPVGITADATGELAVKLGGKLSAVTDANGNLKVEIDNAKYEDVVKVTKTGSGENEEVTTTPLEAVLTLTDPEDSTLKARVKITANPILDPAVAPGVALVDGGASDTTLNVNVTMDAETPVRPGLIYYVVTAEWKAPEVESGQPAPTIDDKLQSKVVKVVPRKGNTTRVELVVGKSSNLGEGATGDYEVTAKAVYALNGVEPTEATTSDANNDVTVVSDKLSTGTIEPLFEAALKLKKDKAKKPASTLYTGQTDLYIATPQWSKKNVNYKITETSVVDLTGDGVYAKINDEGDLVVTSVASWADLGKHTLQVTARADETGKGTEKAHTMYASRATITVNVVKGINHLEVITPGNQIYKQSGRAATYTVKPQYEQEWKGNKLVDLPKTKKVTWSIVGVDSTDNDSYEVDDFELTAAPAGITIKNGKITVAKTFSIDARHPKNNQFKVLVQAADFAGNKTAALSCPIYITDKAVDVSNLVIVKEDDEKGGYNVIAVQDGKNAVKVSAQAIEDAQVYALAQPVSTGFVSYAKWNTIGAVDGYNIDCKSSNAKVLGLDYYEDYSTWNIDSVVPGKKVNIKVTATDGSKKNNTFKLDLGYTETSSNKAALEITAYTANNAKSETVYNPAKEADIVKKVEKNFTVPGVARLGVRLKVADYDDSGKFKSLNYTDGFVNYKLTVKGGKATINAGGYATIYTTSKVTTLNLTVGAGKTAEKYTYVLTNDAYSASIKAPKVKVGNSLYQYYNAKEQIVKMTALNGKETFGDNKYAKVEIDWTSRTDKNAGVLGDLDQAIDNKVIKLDKDTGAFDVAFAQWAVRGKAAGSYKLKVTVGTGSTLAGFKAETLPATVTVKIVKNKAFTFKPATTYTINKVDGAAVLTGKTNLNAKLGETASLTFSNLQNANINGKSNKFTHYFRVRTDAAGTNYLELNTDDDAVLALMYEATTDANGNVTGYDKTKPITLDLTKINKQDLTGYVTYRAEANVDHYNPGSVAQQTVKITVKVVADPKNGKVPKASQKYAPESGTEIKPAANSKTNVNILVNGAFVKAAYAVRDESKAKQNAAELDVDSVNAKGQVVLKATSALDKEKKGGYTINMLVVPETSYYVAQIAKETNAEARNALIVQYGIPVKVTIVAKDNAKDTRDPEGTKAPTEDETKATIAITTTTSEIEIPTDAAKEVIYAATVTGASDETVIWSVEAGETGVTINENTGVLTVPTTAQAGSVTITATLAADESIKATKTVTIKKADGSTVEPTLTAVGLKVKDNRTAEVSKGDSGLALVVELTYSDGSTPEQLPEITWEVKDQSDQAVNVDGTNIKIEKGSNLEYTLTLPSTSSVTTNTLKITAKVGEIPSEALPVTVK